MTGASPAGTGLSQAEPEVSALRASIPSAGVGITGTRGGLSPAQSNTLSAYLADFRERGVLWQHNGDCIGADKFAGAKWRLMGGLIDLHPPKVGRLRAFQSGDFERDPEPFDVRNRNIVDESAVLIALPRGSREELRSGTWATVRYARRQRKPLIIAWPDGNATVENWAAQGIEAAEADETRSGSAVGESPVRDSGCAQGTAA